MGDQVVAVLSCTDPQRPRRPVGRADAGLVVLLTPGRMLSLPAVRDGLPDLAEEGRPGLYTGA